MAEVDPARLDRQPIGDLVADADFGREQQARAEVGADSVDNAVVAAAVDREADAGTNDSIASV